MIILSVVFEFHLSIRDLRNVCMFLDIATKPARRNVSRCDSEKKKSTTTNAFTTLMRRIGKYGSCTCEHVIKYVHP